ncbi:MAG: hypothetical protein LBR49_01640 [Tannerella sp.]|jgi:hypothetical protein|nr:hypothetical protein [Tannerella sp.]
MKALLISFFAAILCFSLFLDGRETTNQHVDEIKYTIRSEAYDTLRAPDTLFYTAQSARWLNMNY